MADPKYLSNVLIQCPSYHALHPLTERALFDASMRGACVVRSHGLSDVSWHRNVIAQAAVELLEVKERLEWVLFLDSDIVFTPIDVAQLREEADGLREHAPFLSARYVTRGNGGRLAAREHDGAPLGDFVQVDCGLGFAICRAFDFLRLTDAVPAVEHEGYAVPVIAEAHHHGDGWESEDFHVCRKWREKVGGLVLLSPTVAVGHPCEQIVYPELPGPKQGE